MPVCFYKECEVPLVLTIENCTYVLFNDLGTCEVVALQQGDATHAPAKYIRTITVSKGDQTITFNPLPTVIFGDPDVDPGATASSGLPITYSLDCPGVAIIEDGKIHPIGIGTCSITASQPGNDFYNAAPDVILSIEVNFLLDGLENPVSQKEFRIYSTNDMLNIVPLNDEWNGKVGNIRIIDITGRTISNHQSIEFRSNSMIQIDAPVSEGTYIIELRSGMLHHAEIVIIR